MLYDRCSNRQITSLCTLLGLGANAIGGHNLFPNLDEEEGKEIVRTALRNGINLIDTAYIYGEGRSEELIGDVLQEEAFDRNQVIIATKAAHRPEEPNKKIIRRNS